MLDELTLEIRGYQNDQAERIVTVKVLDPNAGTIVVMGDGVKSILDILRDGCQLFVSLDAPVGAGKEWKELLEVPPDQVPVEVSVGIKIKYLKPQTKAVTPLRFPGMEGE